MGHFPESQDLVAVLQQVWVFPPRDIWQYLETFFWIATIRGKVLLLSSKQRPRMVLNNLQYFPDGLDGKESACSARNPRLISGSERSPGGGHGNPLQYPCLENPMDRRAWLATVHGVTKSQSRLTWLSAQAQKHSELYWLLKSPAGSYLTWAYFFPQRFKENFGFTFIWFLKLAFNKLKTIPKPGTTTNYLIYAFKGGW